MTGDFQYEMPDGEVVMSYYAPKALRKSELEASREAEIEFRMRLGATREEAEREVAEPLPKWDREQGRLRTHADMYEKEEYRDDED